MNYKDIMLTMLVTDLVVVAVILFLFNNPNIISGS